MAARSQSARARVSASWLSTSKPSPRCGRSSVDIFEDEAVDWTRLARNDASWIRYDRYLGPQLRHTDEMAVQLLGFDALEPPFDDPLVRRAVAMAVDWRGLATLDGANGAPPTSIVVSSPSGWGSWPGDAENTKRPLSCFVRR